MVTVKNYIEYREDEKGEYTYIGILKHIHENAINGVLDEIEELTGGRDTLVEIKSAFPIGVSVRNDYPQQEIRKKINDLVGNAVNNARLA